MKEICICAAVKEKDGTIIRGHRHHDCLRAIRDRHMKRMNTREGYGFITSRNRFVTREEGRELQDAAGIPSADKYGYRANILFSEDLY